MKIADVVVKPNSTNTTTNTTNNTTPLPQNITDGTVIKVVQQIKVQKKP